MALRTKDTDKGFKQALAQMQIAKRGPVVQIGFQGREAETMHPESQGTATIADVATFNEFGTSKVPERSFIRSTMDENKGALLTLNRELFYMISAGKTTTQKALTILGIKIKALIQKKITDLRTPPNAASTIRQKRSSNPLIDTGVMRASVTHTVKMDGSDAA